MYQCLGLGSEEEGGCGEDWWHPACLLGLPRDWHTKVRQEKVEDKKEGDTQNGETKPIVASPNNGVVGNDTAMAATEQANEPDEDEPTPPDFPAEDDFETFLCYKCVEAHPWIKRYAGTEGFLRPILYNQSTIDFKPKIQDEALFRATEASTIESTSRKRKADDSPPQSPLKRSKSEVDEPSASGTSDATPVTAPPTSENSPRKPCRYVSLPPAPTGTLSLFLREDFRDHLCRCPTHFPLLSPHHQLLEEEDPYEPPLSVSSEAGAPGSSVGTGSLLDRGERALSNVDRVRAIGITHSRVLHS